MTFATRATFAASRPLPAFPACLAADTCVPAVLFTDFFGAVRFATGFAGDFRAGAFRVGAFFGGDFRVGAFCDDDFRVAGFRPGAFRVVGLRFGAFRVAAFETGFASPRARVERFALATFFRAAGCFFRGAAFFTAFLTSGTPRLRLVTDVARVRHFFGTKSTIGATNVNSNRS